MRIVIDLDGTICEIKKPEQNYSEVRPLPGAAERIRELRKAGHYIIITTARHMATCEGNEGKVLKKIGAVTFTWLEAHGIEYDEIYFGKPNADLYIDDRALRFEHWSDLSEDRLQQMRKSR